MTSRFLRTVLVVAAAAMLLPSGPANADAIDGNWCFRDGRHLSIEGPRIVTPGGAAITGNYGRHSFSYTVPATEPGSGTDVSMVLVNEDTVHLQSGTAAADSPEVWHRCEFTS